MKWHIENVIAALRSALRLVDAVLDALDGDQEQKRHSASLSTHLRLAIEEAEALRAGSPSNEGPAVPSSPTPDVDRRPAVEGLDEEETPPGVPPRP